MLLESRILPNVIYSTEVADARESGKPIIALETSVIAQGMPWPENLDTAFEVEDCIRKVGAVPATIAVLEGKLRIGLSRQEIEKIARSNDISKVSRADLATCMAAGGNGATTVASTIIAAGIAGIKTFSTGGIGGVHIGGEHSLDISSDLHALSKIGVTVVCAGAKAILDIPKTLELLETLGVPVIAYGQNFLPAFWSSESPFKAPMRMDDPHTIALAHLTRAMLGISGGQVIANPIPKNDEIPYCEIIPIISRSVEEAAENQISGKNLTPFLLTRISKHTYGRSLEANVALVKNNAMLATAIAREIASMENKEDMLPGINPIQTDGNSK